MIKILTDSTADFSLAEAAALGLAVVPLGVHFGSEHYLDGVDLPLPTFYNMLERAAKLPTTSQPGPAQFLEHFEAAKQSGDTLVCVLLSSALSGTCQSAEIAKAECEYDNIYIVDSGSATLGLNLLVRRAVQLLHTGYTAQEIVQALNEAKTRLQLYAVVDTLKYLHKGGRLSGVAAVAGTLLGIKPVIQLACGEKVSVAGKARGLPGAYVLIFKQLEKNGGVEKGTPVCIGYTGERKGLEPFAHYVTHNMQLEKPLVQAIGTVIGTHGGPGACGIAFFAAEAPQADA